MNILEYLPKTPVIIQAAPTVSSWGETTPGQQTRASAYVEHAAHKTTNTEGEEVLASGLAMIPAGVDVDTNSRIKIGDTVYMVVSVEYTPVEAFGFLPDHKVVHYGGHQTGGTQ